jgi:hypothetical protein
MGKRNNKKEINESDEIKKTKKLRMSDFTKELI